MLDHVHAGGLADVEQHAHVPRGIGLRTAGHVHDVHRAGDRDAVVDAQHESVHGERRIEVCERVGGAVTVAVGERETQRLGVLRQRAREGQQRDAGRRGRREVRAIRAVDEDDAIALDAGQRDARRVDGERTGGVAIGECERALRQGAKRGVLPGFVAAFGQAIGGEGLEVFATRGIQPGDARRGNRGGGIERRPHERGRRVRHAGSPVRSALRSSGCFSASQA